MSLRAEHYQQDKLTVNTCSTKGNWPGIRDVEITDRAWNIPRWAWWRWLWVGKSHPGTHAHGSVPQRREHQQLDNSEMAYTSRAPPIVHTLYKPIRELLHCVPNEVIDRNITRRVITKFLPSGDLCQDARYLWQILANRDINGLRNNVEGFWRTTFVNMISVVYWYKSGTQLTW